MDTKELQRLENIYGLFQFELSGDTLYIQFPDSSKIGYDLGDGRLPHYVYELLDHEHAKAAIKADLERQYPNLYISCTHHLYGVMISVYIQRDGRPVEAAGSMSVTDRDLHKRLGEWNEEAGKAKQKGYFFCTEHKMAEPMNRFSHQDFAGYYCT